jgi:hypothetical protein
LSTRISKEKRKEKKNVVDDNPPKNNQYAPSFEEKDTMGIQ